MKQGQSIIAGLLYFFMAIVIVALLMPTVRTFINIGLNSTGNSSHPVVLGIILTYWPVFFVIMLLLILLIIIRR